MSVHTVSLRI